jgi:plasmid stabilization system protein ParE
VSPRYRLTPSAQQDVDRITDFVAEDNVDAALRVYDALEEAFRHLAERPGMGDPGRRNPAPCHEKAPD